MKLGNEQMATEQFQDNSEEEFKPRRQFLKRKLPSVVPSNNPSKKHRYYADNFKECTNSQEEVKPSEMSRRQTEARKAPTPFSR